VTSGFSFFANKTVILETTVEIMPTRLLYISVLTVLSVSVTAQSLDDRKFRLFTIKEGLSDNYVTSIEQDEWGYIWIGTDVGLNRFDGSSFTKFSQGSTTLPLLSGKIVNLRKMDDQRLAILNRGGFQLLNTSNFALQNFLIPDTTAFNTYLNYPWDAKKLANGSYAVSPATGFYVFDKPGKISFRYDAYSQKDLGKKRILYGRDIFSAGNGYYPVYLEEGKMGCYSMEKKMFREVRQDEAEWRTFYRPSDNDYWISKYQLNDHAFIFISLEGNNIVFYDHLSKKAVISPLPFHCKTELNWLSRIARVDDSTFLIIGGKSGLYSFRLNIKSGKILCSPRKFLASYRITCVFLDKEKRLWLGTPDGLLQERLAGPFISCYSIKPFSQDDSLVGHFTSAYRYKDKLYLGRFSRSAGLAILDAATMKLERQINFFGTNNTWNEVNSVQRYYHDTLWLGTNGGILWFDVKTAHYGDVLKGIQGIPNEIGDKIYYEPGQARFIYLATAKDGYAWFCCALLGLVGRYNIAERTVTFFTLQSTPALPFDKVKSITYDSYGNVWLGGHSLARWNNNSDSFDTLITVYGGKRKFNDNIVAISSDTNASLWLHNEENGLLQYDIKNKKFVYYGSRDGLPSEVFESFSPVINDNLWMASRTDLTRFNTRTKKVIVYDQSDGLPGQSTTSRTMYYDSTGGCLYMLFSNDVARIPGRTPEAQINNANGLLIQELTVNNKHLFQPPANIRLKPGDNNLSIRFTIVDFETNNYSFAYRLNDNSSWINLGHDRDIVLSGLAPGPYKLELKATGKNGMEKFSDLDFFLAPPFWKTTWFKITVSLLLATLLSYLYRTRINEVRKKANLDRLVAQTEMKALHAQMNPHFIFNCLNSIKEMILINENRQASHYLSKFAHLIRITLNNSSKPFISLRNTIDYLQRYLEMEQIRKANFSYNIKVDESIETESVFLPPMLIQPFIENALWHGTPEVEEHIEINVTFIAEDNHLVCKVEDNGIGIETSIKQKEEQREMHPDHYSVGIMNVKQRIQLLNEKYNWDSRLAIEDKRNLTGYHTTGTIVTVHFPLKTMRYDNVAYDLSG